VLLDRQATANTGRDSSTRRAKRALKKLIIDASIAIRWVVEEDGTEWALALRKKAKLGAPDLIVPECANILWKKVGNREISKEEALIAARLLQGSEIELVSAGALMEAATRLAIELDHPAYDCLYLALAMDNDCRFVTADERFVTMLRKTKKSSIRDRALSLAESAAREQ
jgi:predicted nucleic acid-binding protein